MKKSLLKWALLFLFAVLFVFASSLYKRGQFKLTDGFAVDKLSQDLNFYVENEVSSSFPSAICSQKFTYLGKGGQSYAFLSEDKQHVLKFFKAKAFTPKWWVSYLPDVYPFLTYKNDKISSKQNALKTTFNGYLIGNQLLKEETGIVFLHFNKDVALQSTVVVRDKAGNCFCLPLDDYPFVIQKYAEPNEQLLTRALLLNNLDLVKQSIDEVFALYLKEYHQGVYDKDLGVLHNVGFALSTEKPLHFDIGCLLHDEKMKKPKHYKKNLVAVAKRYEMWIKKNHMYAYELVVPYIEEKLFVITGDIIKLSCIK